MTGKRWAVLLCAIAWAALAWLPARAQSTVLTQDDRDVFLPMLAGYEVASTPAPVPPRSEPVYALLGNLMATSGRRYSYYLITVDNRVFGLAGESPEEDARISALATTSPGPQVKVWGTAYEPSGPGGEASIVVTGILPAQDTPTPTPTATPSPTPTPTGPPVAVVRFSLVTLRAGPSQSAAAAGSVVYNQRCAIVGRYPAGTWLQIDCGDGTQGWIDSRLVEVEGNLGAAPLLAPLPTLQPTQPPTPIPAPTSTPQAAWRVTLFTNMGLVDPPVAQAFVDVINFDWGYNSPSPLLPADGFSMRFESTQTFAPGAYQLRAQADDGVRVWIDNQLIIDEWTGASGRTYTASRNLSGRHDLRVEYYEASGLASLLFDIAKQDQALQWQAEYFANTALSGSPQVVQREPSSSTPLSFDWGTGSPAPGVIPVDLWSARWSGNFAFDSGDYIFRAISDDGVRVYLNGLRVIDQWRDGYNNVTNRFVGVGRGTHSVVVEFYERTGRAELQVWWYFAPPETGIR